MSFCPANCGSVGKNFSFDTAVKARSETYTKGTISVVSGAWINNVQWGTQNSATVSSFQVNWSQGSKETKVTFVPRKDKMRIMLVIRGQNGNEIGKDNISFTGVSSHKELVVISGGTTFSVISDIECVPGTSCTIGNTTQYSAIENAYFLAG